ncbi:hypothetical protein RND81_03G095800 [Saponaria officinalis]|uniref:Uncharacterized protein n=1 Tax=Saponaria officinalis TaxID=3572 RepID=A0AAW1LZ77_SAPOF
MAALNKVEKAHHMYRDGRYADALGFYSAALSIAKNTPQRIALHSNRAACFLKLHDFKQAADECTSVLELDNKHTGALMLRAQTLVTLKEYQSALFDVNRLLELNPSSEVYLNLQARLKTQLSLAPIPEAEEEDDDTSEATVEGHDESDDDSEQKADNTAVNDVKYEPEDDDVVNGLICSETETSQVPFDPNSNGWKAIPKPKGHSRLDYSRWDRVAEGSSDEDEDSDEDEEESQPRYRFRVKTVDVRHVK